MTYLVPGAPRRTRRISGWLEIALCVVAIGVVLVAIWPPIVAIPLQAAANYGEGWNATNTARLALGLPLYSGSDQFFVSNYPPLYHELMSVVARSELDVIAAGRWLSLASMLVTGMLAGLTIWSWTKSRSAAVVAGALLVALSASHAPGYVATNDPTWLAHALMMAALYLLRSVGTDRQSASTGRLTMSALLIVLGGFVKHSLLPLPVAVSLWLLTIDRRLAGRWMLLLGGLTIVGFVVSVAAFGPVFLEALLRTPRTFSLGWTVASAWTVKWTGLAAMALLFHLRLHKDRESTRFAAAYLFSAGAIGLLLAGGGGVADNIWFDLHFAVAIGLGLSWGLRHEEATRRVRSGKVPLALTCILLLAVSPDVLPRVSMASFAARQSREVQALSDIQLVRSTSGRVVCTDLALCYRAGKLSPVDVYGIQQRLLTGVVGPDELVRFLIAQDVELIQLAMPGRSSWPELPASAIDRLKQFYAPDGKSGVMYFLRRRSASAPEK